MAIFHHHAAIVAMGEQLISQSHPSETIGQNIDPALHGQELSGWVLPLDAAAGGDLGAMPSTGEYGAEGELLRANVEEWIIDPRLRTSAGSLEPPSAGGGNFHSTAGGCIDGIVPVGEMQNYLNDWQEDHSRFLENTAQQWQCLSSSAGMCFCRYCTLTIARCPHMLSGYVFVCDANDIYINLRRYRGSRYCPR